MNRHDMDWDELGAVWRATTLDRDALAARLDRRLRRQARFRRLEILSEILLSILSVFVCLLLWLNLEDEGRWRQVGSVLSVLALLAGSWAISLWMRRGTGGEAQSLSAMIDLAILRGESRRRRVQAIALGGGLGLVWGVGFWFLLLDSGNGLHTYQGLAFILAWCSVWGVGLTGWEYVKWRREQKYLAQFREIKEMLREDG